MKGRGLKKTLGYILDPLALCLSERGVRREVILTHCRLLSVKLEHLQHVVAQVAAAGGVVERHLPTLAGAALQT